MFLIPKTSYSIRTTKHKGRGVFARRDIPAGTVIGDYLGTLMRPSEEDEISMGLYTFMLNDSTDVYPDLKSDGAHLTNHSCMPNCDAYLLRGHVIYVAARHVFKGEELTIDYSLDSPEDETTPCPHVCKCGTLLCRGTMHTNDATTRKWNVLFYKQGKKKSQHIKLGPYGSILPPLKKYPQSVGDNRMWDIFSNSKKKPLLVKSKELPPLTVIRKYLRDSGRVVRFMPVGFEAIGILNGHLIGKTIR